MVKIRKPIVAGQFYPENKTELKEQIQKFVKTEEKQKNIISAIVPHAGYSFSGKAAGNIYSILPFCDTYIIIGTNHSGVGENISISLEDFETPFGIVKNDTELGKEIIKKLKIKPDNESHRSEHSIEVQLPFLQEIQETRQKNKSFKIVPIILQKYSIETCKNLAEAIFKSAEKLKENIIILASSDFTHSGPGYGCVIDKKLDKQAIDKILKINSAGFLETAKQTTICGAGAILVALEFVKLKEGKEVKLLDYYTSQDIMPSQNWVGYAAIAFLA